MTTLADLPTLVSAELAEPVPSQVTAMAAAIAAKHPSARAVLFYGSCLREASLDGLMLDFYLIVGDYHQAFGARWLAAANRLLPPNVFPFAHEGLVAKYAVLSEADFHRLAGPETRNVSVWARFAQPSRLVWVADEGARATAVASVARAAPTLLAAARPCVADHIAPLDFWAQAFALTYAAELRAERKTRAGSVVDADPDRYRRFTLAALNAAGIVPDASSADLLILPPVSAAARRAASREWARRRREGKALTLARLAKASATYAGGLDYLAWKISRHSGEPIAIKPWQRRLPLLGAISLLPRLIARGAIR